jgi:hypothetical protein
VRVRFVTDERPARGADQVRPTGALAPRAFFLNHKKINVLFIVFVRYDHTESVDRQDRTIRGRLTSRRSTMPR